MSLAAAFLAAAIVAVTVARERRSARRQSAARADAAFVGAALETLALTLRCGAAPLEALAAVTTGDGALGALWSRAADAETMSDAAGWLDRGPPALCAVAGALRLAEFSGSGLAGLVEAVAGPVRAQQQVDRELGDALAGVRSSANLLTGLPLLGILLASGIGADPVGVLFHTTLGSACLVLGTGLGGLARLWTGALVERARVAGQA